MYHTQRWREAVISKSIFDGNQDDAKEIGLGWKPISHSHYQSYVPIESSQIWNLFKRFVKFFLAIPFYATVSLFLVYIWYLVVICEISTDNEWCQNDEKKFRCFKNIWATLLILLSHPVDDSWLVFFLSSNIISELTFGSRHPYSCLLPSIVIVSCFKFHCSWLRSVRLSWEFRFFSHCIEVW